MQIKTLFNKQKQKNWQLQIGREQYVPKFDIFIIDWIFCFFFIHVCILNAISKCFHSPIRKALQKIMAFCFLFRRQTL